MAEQRFHDAQRILALSTIVDMGLAFIKVTIGWLANSHALVADGIHSLSDLLTDLMAWFLTQIASEEPDSEHPYGHRRFETLGTVMLGGVLLGVALLIVYDALVRLVNIQDVTTPGWFAMVAAALSIGVKEWLYQISREIGEREKSPLLIANAWHHRSDAFSSIVVLLGVGGALLGIVWLEMVASIIVAVMIAGIGWRFCRQSVEELVDTALPESDVLKIEEYTRAMPGVRGVHSVRTRRMGPEVLLDIHIQVAPDVSVSEGHHIGDWVQRELLDNFHDISDIVYHIDAEDDAETEGTGRDLPIAPLREEVRNSLREVWQEIPHSAAINQITLHYLEDGVQVEVFVPMELLSRADYDASRFGEALREKAESLTWIRDIAVWYG